MEHTHLVKLASAVLTVDEGLSLQHIILGRLELCLGNVSANGGHENHHITNDISTLTFEVGWGHHRDQQFHQEYLGNISHRMYTCQRTETP